MFCHNVVNSRVLGIVSWLVYRMHEWCVPRMPTQNVLGVCSLNAYLPLPGQIWVLQGLLKGQL